MLRSFVAAWCGSALCVAFAAGAEPADSPFESSFAGKPYPLAIESLDGDGQPRPGDVIHFDGFALTLGTERKLDLSYDPADERRLLLGEPGGKQRVVGVKVEFGFDDDRKRISHNPLSKLSPDEIRGLWGIYLNDWPAGIEKQLQHIDVKRTSLTITSYAAPKETKSLPAIPAGIRYLCIDDRTNFGFTDLTGLARQSALKYLSIRLMTVDELDVGLLRQNKDLRILRVGGAGVKGQEALSALTELRLLALGHCDGITDVEFVRPMAHLKYLDVQGTKVRDLAPLDRLKSLKTVNVQSSQVEKLPRGPLPALVELRAFSTPASDEEAATFRKAHPGCKLLHRWNDTLREQVAKADRLRVRTGGTCHRDPEQEKTLFEVKGKPQVEKVLALISVDEQENAGHCMCCGEPSFEFYEGDQLVAMIGFHHGHSLRWAGGWPADGRLTVGSADALSAWLANNGVAGPEAERRQAQRQQVALQRHVARAHKVIPAEVLQRLRGAKSVEDAEQAFTDGIADAAKRAETCLRMLGCNQISWSLATQFELLASDLLLPQIDQAALSSAIATVADDTALAEGAARWLFAARKHDTVSPAALAKALPTLTKLGFTHPRANNRVETILALGRIGSTEAIKLLRARLTEKFEIRKLAAADETEPGGQVTFSPREYDVDEEFSDRVNAAIVLAGIGDRESLAAIQKIAGEATAAEKEVLGPLVEKLAKKPGR